MMKKVNVLTVSLVAVMAVASARADIASTTYVDDKIQPVETKIDNHIADTTMHVTTAEKTAWNAKEDAANKETALSGYAANSDTKYPTMHVVSTMITDRQSDINNSITSLTNGLNAKQDKSASNVSGTLRTGTYLTAGNGVATNLKALDTAIGAEETRAKAAEKAIDDKIGTPTAGKTIVQMIGDAQTAATYDDSALAGRVTANETAINTLNGDASTAGSVAKSIADAVASYELLSNVTSKGDTDTPVYFDANGLARPITAYDGTAARATADASGNNIVNTYETKAHVGTIPNSSSATTVIGYVDEKVGAVNTAVGNLGTMANESKDDYYTKTAANSQFVEAGAGVTETTTANYLVKYDEQGLVTGGVAAGALAKKDTVAKTDLASALKTEIEGKANTADLGTAAAKNVSENGVAANEAGLVTGGQVQTAISNLNLGTTYQAKSDSTVAAKGNYIAAGSDVKGNLGALDTQLKTTTDTANAAIPKPDGNCTDCVLHFNGTQYTWEEVGR